MSRRRSDDKSAQAFRTISEVSDDLQVPQHVLRFWETKFPQVQPMKRGGGRRYYRPEDIELLRAIRDRLYSDGYTIKGVQKLLREGQLTPPTSGSPVESDEPPSETGGLDAESQHAGNADARAPELNREGRGTALGQEDRRVLREVLEELIAARDALRGRSG